MAVLVRLDGLLALEGECLTPNHGSLSPISGDLAKWVVVGSIRQSMLCAVLWSVVRDHLTVED